MSRLFAAVLLFVGALTLSEARPGPGGGKGDGNGATDRCGASLLVVFPDGSEQTLEPAGRLLDDLPGRMIKQGEDPRSAVKLADLLQKLGASSVTALSCTGQSQDFPFGLPVEGEFYVVQTGKGSLKFVREVRPAVFSNAAEKIKRLRFHKGAPHKK